MRIERLPCIDSLIFYYLREALIICTEERIFDLDSYVLQHTKRIVFI